jgi:hypothetical protein
LTTQAEAYMNGAFESPSATEVWLASLIASKQRGFKRKE